MRRSSIAACITLLFATIVWAANPSPMNLPTPNDAARRQVSPQSTEPEAAALQIPHFVRAPKLAPKPNYAERTALTNQESSITPVKT